MIIREISFALDGLEPGDAHVALHATTVYVRATDAAKIKDAEGIRATSLKAVLNYETIRLIMLYCTTMSVSTTIVHVLSLFQPYL